MPWQNAEMSLFFANNAAPASGWSRKVNYCFLLSAILFSAGLQPQANRKLLLFRHSECQQVFEFLHTSLLPRIQLSCWPQQLLHRKSRWTILHHPAIFSGTPFICHVLSYYWKLQMSLLFSRSAFTPQCYFWELYVPWIAFSFSNKSLVSGGNTILQRWIYLSVKRYTLNLLTRLIARKTVREEQLSCWRKWSPRKFVLGY